MKIRFFEIFTIIPNMGNTIALWRLGNQVSPTPLLHSVFNSECSGGGGGGGGVKLDFQVFIVIGHFPCWTQTRDTTSIKFSNVAKCHNSPLSSQPRMGPCPWHLLFLWENNGAPERHPRQFEKFNADSIFLQNARYCTVKACITHKFNPVNQLGTSFATT